MKIIHTADWHIGKKLHNYDLEKDFDSFIDWLIDFIRKENVEVVLVSGDIFDLANPSSAARSQYYRSLVALRKEVNRIILTGGNHDSPAVLNAPKELLEAFGLEVIGGLPKALEDAIIPLQNRDNVVRAVVAAIPFLRNSDLHYPTVIKTYDERVEAMKGGIQRVFEQVAEICRKKYPEIPALAMGHLFAAGAETSESERDIQIGNQAAVESSAFGDYFSYVALGHIHKPQRVSGTQPIFYSGSPIPLSFSERKDDKRILLVDTEKSWEPESIPVPSFRKLLKIKGDLEQIQSGLTRLPKHDGALHLIEVELVEDVYQAKLLQDLEGVLANFVEPGYEIVKHRARFTSQQKETGDLFEESVHLEELEPQHVFKELLTQEDFSEEERKEIEAAFQELLEEAENPTEG